MIKFLKSNLFFLTIIIVIVFCIYGKAINFGLTNIDDTTFTIKNINFVSNIKNFPKFFLTDCYFGKQTQYYRPVLNISFAIEAILFKNNFKVFHTTNILLFIFSLYLIFLFLSKLNLNTNILKFLIILFAVHPICSSVPVWLPSRNDTLLTIFFMVSLISFINYLKTNKNIFLCIHLLFFTIALFTKETTILLIFIYPLLIYCFNLKISKKQILNNIIYILPLLVVYFILRHFAVRSVNIFIYFTNFTYYIKNIVIGIMLYIEKILYPSYMPIMLYDIKPTMQTYIINITIFISLIYVSYKNFIDKKIVIFSVIFYFLSILPTFLQEDYAFFTHRLIISIVGIIIVLSTILKKIMFFFPRTKNYLIVVFVFLFILFSFCSFIQIDKYKDSFTYWINAYIDAPTYHKVCDGLAKECSNKKLFDKATILSLKSIELNKKFDYYLTYATILLEKGDVALSKQIFEQLLQFDKDNILIYIHLSEIYLLQKDYDNAIKYSKIAIKKAKNIDDKILVLEKLAKTYAVSKKYEESINILLQVLNYNKNKLDTYFLLSMLYEDINDLQNALKYIKQALKIEPSKTEYKERLETLQNNLTKYR